MPGRGAKNKTALGRSLVKEKAARARNARAAKALVAQEGTGFAMSDAAVGHGEAAGVSITEMTALEDFLASAIMAERSFVATRANMRFVESDAGARAATTAATSRGPAGTSSDAAGGHAVAGGINVNPVSAFMHLRIPRRPAWGADTSADELHRLERESFLAWRREVATQEAARTGVPMASGTTPAHTHLHTHLTPFEKNLDVWRQLWQVVERADVLVQIVDARNPLLFRCADLDAYTREVNPGKRCLLLMNKSDFLSQAQRRAWYAYMHARGVDVLFWSAARERERLEEEDRRNAAAHSEALRASDGTDYRDPDTGALRPDLSAAAAVQHDPITTDAAAAAVKPAAGQRQRTAFTAALLSVLDDDEEEEGEQEQHGADAREGVRASTNDSEHAGHDSDAASSVTADEDGEGDEDDAAPAHHEASLQVSEEGAAVLDDEPADAPWRMLTREELLQHFQTAYADLPRGSLGGPMADVARERLRELRAKQRAAAKAAREEELRRREAMAQRLVEVGLGSQLRYGHAGDLVSLRSEAGSQHPATEDGAEDAASDDDEEDEMDSEPEPPRVVGMVGYPNVGKSSTINVLMGATSVNHAAKRVAVASTPGKTKHFQTLPLSDDTMLCDCPGLVFPSFIVSKEEMVVNGILPIDQLRDYVPPMRLLCQRIPRRVWEATYGIRLPVPVPPQDPNRQPTVYELLDTFCAARGFMASAHAGPDRPRGARVLLKDFTEGKLVYCEPPPGGWAAWCDSADAVVPDVFAAPPPSEDVEVVRAPMTSVPAQRSGRVTHYDNVLLPSVVRGGVREKAATAQEGEAEAAHTALEQLRDISTASASAPTDHKVVTKEAPAEDGGEVEGEGDEDDEDEDEAGEDEDEAAADEEEDEEELDDELLRSFARTVTLRPVAGLGDDVYEMEEEDGAAPDDGASRPSTDLRSHTHSQSSSRSRLPKHGKPMRPRRPRKGEHLSRVPQDPYGTAAVADAASRKDTDAEVRAADALRLQSVPATAALATSSSMALSAPMPAPSSSHPASRPVSRPAASSVGVHTRDPVPAHLRGQATRGGKGK